jgi:elongation factor P--beta-lysine ligase
MNEHTRNVFITRSKMVTYVRKYFDERDFVEVETPMMNSIAGEQLLSHSKAIQKPPQRSEHGHIHASCT